MHVRSLELESFTRHTSTKVTFPEKGLVLITGPNGSGKSSFAEGVAFAAWGKTLRGTSPWVEGCAGSVKLTTDAGVFIRKTTAKGTKSADFIADPDAPPRRLFDTATKAKDAAIQAVGDFDTWRRTHVFSSSDADHFTSATDKERKELLEELLGLGIFDEAAKKCAADLKEAKAKLAMQERVVERYQNGRTSTEQAIRALEAAPQEPEPQLPPAPDPDESKRLWDGILAKREAIRAAAQTVYSVVDASLQQAAADTAAELRHARRHREAVSQGTCGACGQGIDERHRAEAEARVEQAVEAADVADKALKLAQGTTEQANKYLREAANREVQQLQIEQADLDAKWRALENAKTAYQQAIHAHSKWSQRRQVLQKQRDELEALWQKDDDLLADASAALAVLGKDVAELAVVQDVLGLRGVRAHVLGQALGGIESVANIYLNRISPEARPLTVTLKPYTEGATGDTVQDKISMDITGCAGGYGYKGSSAGERRRIDAALLLALAEVAAAANGREPGTVFFDEVFDALDEEGVDAVVNMLLELALERTVVVITHSQVLAQRIPATMKIGVYEGVAVAA